MWFLSLKARTLFLIGLILIGNLLVGLLISESLLARFGQQTGQDQLERTARMVDRLLAIQRVNLERQARLIGVLPIMATVIENQDKKTIQDSAEEYRQSLDLDLVYAYDNEGRFLANLGPEPPEEATLVGMVHQTLEQGSVSLGYLSVAEHLYLVALAPVGLPHDPSGVILIGQHTDQRFTNEIKRLARAEISILHNRKIHHSTRPLAERQPIEKHLFGQSTTRLPENLEDAFFSALHPITDDKGHEMAHLLIQVPRNSTIELIGQLRRSLLLGGGAFLAITLLLGLTYTIRRLIRPLEEVVQRLRQISTTHDLSLRLPTEGPTELAQVGLVFNELMTSQQELVANLRESRQVVTSRTEALELANARMTEEIAERIRGEDQIRKLSLAVEQSPASIMICDTEGYIEYVNPRFTMLTGYHAAEAIGRNPRILNSGQTDPKVFDDLWATISQQKVWSGEFINQKKNGEIIVESALISPILDESGQTTHFLAVKEDITARKKNESELVQAKLEAQAANRAKSEFLANMSHEIRTPMNAIMGMTSVVLDTELDEEQSECLQIVYDSADSLLAIINDILDFSKIESGKLEIILEEFELQEELQRVADFFSLKLQTKNLAFSIHIDPSLTPSLVGDPVRLRQILVNLMSNSLKFTSEGQISLYIAPVGEMGPNQLVEFAVADTGIGIPQERQEAIFESFAQASGSTTRKYGGTGLGLTISKRLVQLMGGEIWLESAEGVGSTFFFTLPLAPGAGQVAPEAETFESVDLTGLTVLLAEDQPFNRQLVAKWLENEGVSLVMAESGDRAMSLLKERDFDLLLTDLHMPGLSGLELARLIRAGKTRQPKIPIIALTANAFSETKTRALAAGMQDFLAKPFMRHDLIQAIIRQLSAQ
ncbi:MAG: ATP-binding protein [bacterium]|nr:ATP-binding protein [bacterium]